MKTITKLILAFALIAAFATAQTSVPTVTLGAAITNTNANNQTITVSSTSTMQGLNSQGAPNTVLYCDAEFMWVVSVTNSTQLVVARAKGIGEGGRPSTHANGALCYYNNVVNTGTSYTGTTWQLPAASAFKMDQPSSESIGSCTATAQPFLPKIYLFSGDILDCKNTSSGGQWIVVSHGTTGVSGSAISAFCTGTTGSGETEYLNGAACSGATTATFRYTASRYGTLANLYISGSANVVSMGSDAVTVYKNGSSTAITCTIAAGTKTCSDLAHSIAVAPGDYIQIQVVSTASDTLANVSATLGLY
jgi:hypothetical protein